MGEANPLRKVFALGYFRGIINLLSERLGAPEDKVLCSFLLGGINEISDSLEQEQKYPYLAYVGKVFQAKYRGK